MRGKGGVCCFWSYCCVAGAALGLAGDCRCVLAPLPVCFCVAGSIWCLWRYVRVAGAAFGASGATFACQVQHFYSLGIAGARFYAVSSEPISFNSSHTTQFTQLTHLSSFTHHHTSLHTSRLTTLHSKQTWLHMWGYPVLSFFVLVR